jgi:hypothetical protein
MMSLEWLAAGLGFGAAALIVVAGWLAGARCSHCGRLAQDRSASALQPRAGRA